MSDTALHPLEDLVRAALAAPAPRPQFQRTLRARLATAAPHDERAPRPTHRRRWALAAGALLIILALTLALGPQRVLAQVLSWFGYVPGTGYVQTENGLRVLAEPQSQERDGIRADVLSGLVDDEHTTLTLQFQGIRQDQKPNSEDIVGCWQQPSLLLPTGEVLEILGGEGGGGPSWMRMQFSYPALPEDVNEVVLQVPCVPEVLPGLGPEDWRIPLRFVPAPPDFQTLPVLPLPQASPESEDGPYGFALMVDDYVELEDGYLIRGRLSWEQSEFTMPEFWWIGLTLVDADGNNIPVEFEDFPNPPSDPDQRYLTWVLRTNTKYITSPAHVVLGELSVRVFQSQESAAEVAVDLGNNPVDGQVWPVDAELPIGAHSAHIESLTFASRADGTYSLLTRVLLDPATITYVNLSDKDNHSQMYGSYSAGEQTGVLELGTIYDYFPAGVHRFWVDNYFVRFEGPWTAQLTLPPPSGDPLSTRACLTSENWQAATAQPPANVNGHVLVQDHSLGAMLPGLALLSIDGNQRQEINVDGWPALSPDGRQIAYTRDGLHIFDLETGQTRTLIWDSSYAIAWSPDGAQLALVRSGQGVYVINADSTDLRPVPGNSRDVVDIAGWMPDGEHIVVSRIVPEGSRQQTLNIHTGAVSDQLLIDNLKGGFARLAPDGEYLTYGEQIFGGFNYSLFLAALDGSNTRLLAESGAEVMFSAGAWLGPEWLVVNVYQPGTTAFHSPLLLHVSTCESYALSLPDAQVISGQP